MMNRKFVKTNESNNSTTEEYTLYAQEFLVPLDSNKYNEFLKSIGFDTNILKSKEFDIEIIHPKIIIRYSGETLNKIVGQKYTQEMPASSYNKETSTYQFIFRGESCFIKEKTLTFQCMPGEDLINPFEFNYNNES